MQKKRLIVNADDFGLTKGVSKGIIHGMEKGIITSTTLLTNTSTTEHAAKLAVKRKVDVGVHLNAVSYKPLTKTRYLTHNKILKNVFAIGWIVTTNSNARKELYNEFDAQIRKAIELGITPSHLDSHKWSTMFPAVNSIAIKVAKKHNIKKMRRAVERFHPSLYSRINTTPLKYTTQLLKSMLISSLSDITTKQFEKEKIKYPDYYTGIMQIGCRDPATYFDRVIDTLNTGTTELMVHPGYYSKNLQKFTYFTKERERELKALTSKKLKKLIKERNAELIGFNEL